MLYLLLVKAKALSSLGLTPKKNNIKINLAKT